MYPLKLWVLVWCASLLWGCQRTHPPTNNQATMNTQIGEKNKQTVRAFFKALEQENVEALVALFAPDAEHINPYASGLFPAGAKGKDEIRNYWAPVFPNFDGMQFPIEEIYAMEDPTRVYVKYQGKIKLKGGAGYYQNDYYSTFRFNQAGLITEYVEIFNPIVAARGFGLIDQIK
jgi:ketosteroid isomerase-like protein